MSSKRVEERPAGAHSEEHSALLDATAVAGVLGLLLGLGTLLFYGEVWPSGALAAWIGGATALGGSLLIWVFGGIAAGLARPLRGRRGRLVAGLGTAFAALLLWQLVTLSRLAEWVWSMPQLLLAAVGVIVGSLLAAGLGATLLLRLPLPGAGRRAPGIGLAIAYLSWAAGAFLAAREAPRATLAAPPPAVAVQPSPQAAPACALGDSLNLLLLTIDTLRADHLSGWGYPRRTSPTLDSLFAQGVVLERALCNRTNTAPSTATLLSGTYPPTHRVLNNKQPLPAEVLVLPEILRQHGYLTRAVVSNPVITETFNFDQGFDRFTGPTDILQVRAGDLHESETLNPLVLEGLEGLRQGRGFLWAHYKDPHAPYLVPEPERSLFLRDSLATLHRGAEVVAGSGSRGTAPRSAIVEDDRRIDFLAAQYDAEILHLDRTLRQVWQRMSELDLWRNTLVVITADHGESLWEHDYFFNHGEFAYEPTAHVPLLFLHPRLPRGKRIPRSVSLVDVAPTILELLGIPPPATMEGASLAPLLLGRGDAPPRDHHFIMANYRWGYQTHAVTTDRHKYIVDVDERWAPLDVVIEGLGRLCLPGASPYRFRRLRPELFDLAADPGEVVNLSGRRPDLEAALRTELRDWMEQVYEKRPVRLQRDAEMSPEMRDAIRSMGYL